MNKITEKYNEILKRYNEQRIEGTHENEPRKGYYKIHKSYRKEVDGRYRNMATASWKLTDDEDYIYFFTVEIIIDSLRLYPKPHHSTFFDKRIVGKTIHVTSTSIAPLYGDDTSYKIEWRMVTDTETNIAKLNKQLRQGNSDKSNLMQAIDDSADIWLDDLEDEANF